MIDWDLLLLAHNEQTHFSGDTSKPTQQDAFLHFLGLFPHSRRNPSPEYCIQFLGDDGAADEFVQEIGESSHVRVFTTCATPEFRSSRCG